MFEPERFTHAKPHGKGQSEEALEPLASGSVEEPARLVCVEGRYLLVADNTAYM
jgi:hypothetical protein